MKFFFKWLLIAVLTGLGVWGAVTAFFMMYVLTDVLLTW